MQNYLKNAIVFLIVVFALLGIMGGLTNATGALKRTNTIFLALASLFFIVSIIVWLISWAYLIKKRSKLPLGKALFIGFSAVYGSLTPIQLGADALRALSLKQFFSVPYRDSIAASMVVKGIKFLLIAVFSSVVLLLFFMATPLEPLVFAALLSGFFVVVFASLLFLLPLKKEFGFRIANFFGKLPPFGPIKRLQRFFENYSAYATRIGKKSLALVALLSTLSLFLEFLALLYSFQAISLSIPFATVAVLFLLISILERTPFLPRGIGAVEAMGFVFLSMSMPSAIAVESIGALLIIFDFVRLVLPSLLSITVYSALILTAKKRNALTSSLRSLPLKGGDERR